MPGRRASSVMSRLTGAANKESRRLVAGAATPAPGRRERLGHREGSGRSAAPLEPRYPQPAQAARARQAARGRVHLRCRQLLGRADRLVDRGLDHVLEHVDVLRVHSLGVDPQLLQLELAADLHRDHPAAGAGLDNLVLQLLLSLGHVGLHLLDLLHHLVQVRLPHQLLSSSGSSKTSSAANSSRRRSISWSWSSVAGPAAGSAVSLNSNARASEWPVMPRTAFATRSRPCSAFFLTKDAPGGKAIVRRSPSRETGAAVAIAW